SVFAGLTISGAFTSVGLADQIENAVSKSVIQRGEKAFQAMGDCIRQSGLIVIGEYRAEGKLSVKEVLKGAASWAGKTIDLKSPILMGCRQQPVPGIKTLAVLLNKDWQKHADPVVEVYDTADQLSVLHCLTPILANPSEHAQFLALSDLFIDPTAHCLRA